MISMIGLIGGLVLLTVLTMRGMNLLVVAPLSALVVAVFNGLPLFPQLAQEGQANFLTNYMGGFSGFIASWYTMTSAGSPEIQTGFPSSFSTPHLTLGGKSV